MDKNKSYLALKKFCLNLGIDLFGVADISEIKNNFSLSRETLKKLDKAVCLGMRLSSSVLEEIAEAPTRLYFHHYRTANVFLDQAAIRIANFIQDKGYSALPVPASQILDWQNQRAHLSHKELAISAGLGWIGRNNLLVNKRLGSQLRLVSILTDMPLKLDKKTKEDCGFCKLCVKACPAGAIKDNSSDFDHIKCFEKLKEFQKMRLVDQYVCGVCVNACGGKKK
ncbi:MAG: 4Fe-4S binding protein [Candidatus Omnitrophica bacterium]|nr:4Fe-4S binding protein [Candidatus Omnitrophota bacterium]